MYHSINSDLITAAFCELGAELISLKFNNTEILWQGKENFWCGKAPLLFPVCGFLKEGRYLHNGNEYKMTVHGFAKDCQFTVSAKENHSITFELKENEQTLKQYPFPFLFKVTYSVEDNSLKINFAVENTGLDPLPFSLGWHPGFNCKYPARLSLDGNYLKYDLAPGGLVNTLEPKQFNSEIDLKKDTFKRGGIVLEKKGSTVTLHTEDFKLSLKSKDFPAMVLWGQPGADFICIEPWHGMGDTVDHNFNITDKKNIILLDQGIKFQRSIKICIDLTK